MRVDYNKLKKIPVETESGVELGRVVELELDTEKHAVAKYWVAKSMFFADKLAMAPGQIVKITAERIIVEDAVCAEKRFAAKAERFSAVEAPTTNAELKN